MKIKIVVVALAVVCVGLAIGLFAVKKQGDEQHNSDVSSIVDFSNQVVNARMKIDDLNQVNLTYSNDMVLSQQQAAQLSNSLAAATATVASSQAALTSAQDQIKSLNGHISDLEIQNKVLDQQANDLTNTIAKLNTLIDDTRSKLATSENNSAFLQQELQKQMAQKAEIEHKFNDLDELRKQVKKIKNDLFIARRLELMKNDNGNKKGAELLIQHTVPATNAVPTGPAGLNVEVGSDGSVKVIPPLGATNPAPAADTANQQKARAALEQKMSELATPH
jgi:DNA repair exonuclease SbcCD ATPase subunit